jgi:hypothetical protein
MFKLFFMFLVFTGIVLILANQLVACQRRPRPLDVRYVPRDLDTYLRTQPLASVQFGDMFTEEDLRRPM